MLDTNISPRRTVPDHQASVTRDRLTPLRAQNIGTKNAALSGQEAAVPMADAFQIEMLTSTKRYVQFSTDVMQFVLFHTDLLETDKLLWLCLYSASEHGSRTTLRSRKWLAEKLGKSESTIIRAVRNLRRNGFLEVSETYFKSQDGTVHQGYNLYRITIPRVTASALMKNLPDRAKARSGATMVPESPRAKIAPPGASAEAWRRLVRRAATVGRGGQVPAQSVGNQTPVPTDATRGGVTDATQQRNRGQAVPHPKPHTGDVITGRPASIRAIVDGLNDVPWSFDAHRRYVQARLQSHGYSKVEVGRLSDQIIWQIRQGYWADRSTRHAVNVLLKLVFEGRYQIPRGYRLAGQPA